MSPGTHTQTEEQSRRGDQEIRKGGSIRYNPSSYGRFPRESVFS